jgi:hypothetical protein
VVAGSFGSGDPGGTLASHRRNTRSSDEAAARRVDAGAVKAGVTLAALALALSACCATLPGRASYPAAEVDARLAAVRARAPAGFTTLAAPPFVIAGDGPPASVREDADQVVRWAATRLKADFFPLDPGRIIEVWLFSSEESYLRNTSLLFGRVPSTPYGYYSPCEHALVMNVSTGYGTLVHEMVHPFMEANFPSAPPWFNEGLASLYEQPSDVGGHLHGGTNWRLAGLQRAVLRERTRSLAALTRMGRQAFYADEPGLNYAEARYLLYYVQEQGLLVRYYQRFLADAASDPTGYDTLQKVLGEADMAAFERRWKAFVLMLTYER